MERAGVAAVHLEDQAGAKRCGHRPGKALVSREEMADRVKAAVDARRDPGFVIMARTDALAGEGLEAALERAVAYVAAGAERFSPRRSRSSAIPQFRRGTKVPVLANLTEFGGHADVDRRGAEGRRRALALYRCSAFRAMNKARRGAAFSRHPQGRHAAGGLGEMQTPRRALRAPSAPRLRAGARRDF
jgi:methylisocitrate lyase